MIFSFIMDILFSGLLLYAIANIYGVLLNWIKEGSKIIKIKSKKNESE